MSRFTVTVESDQADGGTMTIHLDTSSGAPRVLEVTVAAATGGSVSAVSFNQLALDRLVSAFASDPYAPAEEQTTPAVTATQSAPAAEVAAPPAALAAAPATPAPQPAVPAAAQPAPAKETAKAAKATATAKATKAAAPAAVEAPAKAAKAATPAAEAPAKALDGQIQGNSKWCSGAAPRTLTVDLGSAQTVSSFIVKHAGLGGEQTGWNTGAFTLATSTDGVTFSQAAAVTGSRNSRTYTPVPPRTARYVRFEATTPANNGDTAARIYELEVYGSSSAPADLALLRPATADSSCGTGEGPEKAVNGSWLGGWSDKWCSQGSSKWLQTDLGATQHIGSVLLRHAGAGGEYPQWDTRDFDLQTSADGTTWTTRASVRANTADTTTTSINADARYVRLNVITPASDGNTATRIYDMEVRP